MKRTLICLEIILFVSIASCDEESVVQDGISSVTVVNATGLDVQVNYFGEPIIWSKYVDYLGNGSNRVFSLSPNNASLEIVPTVDTLTMLLSEELQLVEGEVYTYYLIGTSTEVEPLLVHETAIPVSTFPDSTFNVRFINLSSDGIGVNLNLTDNPSTLFNNVGFKESSDFMTLDAPPGLWDMGFEVRDANTDAVLATFRQYIDYQFPYGARFHAITLYFYGTSSTSFGLRSMNNY